MKSDHYLECAPWNRRGWTLREPVLSRRMIVYRNEQVYWVCREANSYEELYFENILRFVRMHAQALEPSIKRNFCNFYEIKDQPKKWVNYRQLVTRFTRRVFKYDDGAFDTFSAIFHGFASIWGEVFLRGIARSHFEEGLLWNTFTGQLRREDLSTPSMTSKQVNAAFPSWSWVGWTGGTDIVIDENRSDGELPEILCFVHAHEPSLSIVRARNTKTPRTHGRNHQPVTLKDLEVNNPQLFVRLDSIPEDQSIFFWTRSAKFHLGKNDGSLEFSVINANGKVIGSTGVSPGAADTEGPELEHEFIVLWSRRNEISRLVLLVLQIEWKDNIAYRVNFGEIFEEDWLEALYTSRLIPLG
ncbi:hypothetical protein BDZ94DRAFT_1311315 [Collybia nuda]|uniref:Heterokaryon incompatibility domain-containing protein n=1 Tax=Collybia nuda TaxID=64659 RepID=A0A9P5Y1L6_9AGAR|nr:hypothetical protein BDZ94DRAFT_1311315 [Collybia nuda]